MLARDVISPTRRAAKRARPHIALKSLILYKDGKVWLNAFPSCNKMGKVIGRGLSVEGASLTTFQCGIN